MDDKPVIEFPCDDYPIKVIGTASNTFAASIVAIIQVHDDSFAAGCVVEKASSKGNYTSLRLAIRATGETQLKALHADLMAHPQVKLVL